MLFFFKYSLLDMYSFNDMYIVFLRKWYFIFFEPPEVWSFTLNFSGTINRGMRPIREKTKNFIFEIMGLFPIVFAFKLYYYVEEAQRS